MRDLAAVAQTGAYPPVLFVYQSGVNEGEAFFSRYWPGARAVSDPKLELYRAFGLGSATIGQILHPGVVACSLRALGKGNVQGVSSGDPQQMPGLFYVLGGQVLWQRDYSHVGDSPDWKELPALLASASGVRSAEQKTLDQ